MSVRVVDTPIRTFHARIADPEVFCGGGSVAAVTAAGAAATALLVMRLNAKRRSNASVRDVIELAIADTERAVDAFGAAADEDIAILDDLLTAQQATRSGHGHADYLAALARAAESPLRIAERVVELLDAIAGQLSISTRFTVSDLGAAAVLAEGACRAAFLTAEVNIALLAEADGADPEIARALETRRAETSERVSERTRAIERAARAMMLGANRDERA